jgi:hypothetical protein
MNHINVSVTVGRTPAETMNRLQAFLREYAPEAQMTFALRAPFDIASLNVGLTLHREVTARFVPLGDANRAYAVAWEPVAAGPFPAFSGTLFIGENEADPSETFVTLDGHYHPPLGVAGDVFDALIGKHIAQASAADLLERMSMYMDDIPVRVPAFA